MAKGEAMKKKRKSRHHIQPFSRSRNNSPENIAIIDMQKHNDYHRLFSNRTPQEIIIYLTEYFWNNNWKYATDAVNEIQNQEEIKMEKEKKRQAIRFLMQIFKESYFDKPMITRLAMMQDIAKWQKIPKTAAGYC